MIGFWRGRPSQDDRCATLPSVCTRRGRVQPQRSMQARFQSLRDMTRPSSSQEPPVTTGNCPSRNGENQLCSVSNWLQSWHCSAKNLFVMSTPALLRVPSPQSTVLLVCDVQERFRAFLSEPGRE